MAKKKKAEKQLVYVLKNGDRYNVIAETGKYYLCEGNTQFRKLANRGVIEEAEIENEEAEE